jgi:predicted ATPase
LTAATIADLLRDMIDPASVHSLAKWLQERCDGNPFVLDEIVAQLRADAILTRSGDAWQLDPGRWLRWRAAYTLPETTHDLVSWRLRNLSVGAHSLLEVLAVAGQPLPLALLADVAGAQADLLPIIDDLLTRRLLIETANDMFALPHYLLRETVLQHLSHVRRRLIHRQLAHALAECPARLASLSPWEVARQAVAGEDIELARRYGLPMLSRLPQDNTGAATVDFLHHLYDLLAPSAAPDELIELTRALGDVHQSLGHVSEAAHWRQQYLELAHKMGDAAAQAIGYLEMIIGRPLRPPRPAWQLASRSRRPTRLLAGCSGAATGCWAMPWRWRAAISRWPNTSFNKPLPPTAWPKTRMICAPACSSWAMWLLSVASCCRRSNSTKKQRT